MGNVGDSEDRVNRIPLPPSEWNNAIKVSVKFSRNPLPSRDNYEMKVSPLGRGSPYFPNCVQLCQSKDQESGRMERIYLRANQERQSRNVTNLVRVELRLERMFCILVPAG